MNTATYMRCIATIILCISTHSNTMGLFARILQSQRFKKVLAFQQKIRRPIIEACLPRYTRVFMNDIQKAELAPDEAGKTLYTSGLVGCSSTIGIATTHDNHKAAFLTHYNGFSGEEHIKNVQQFMQEITNKHNINAVKLVLVLAENNTCQHTNNTLHDKDCLHISCRIKNAAAQGTTFQPIETVCVTYTPSQTIGIPPTSVNVELQHGRSSTCDIYDAYDRKKVTLE